ncbi:30S ribosomal protein S27ae [Candidatus Micrarchaeota archaeon]|nr:30S ribosomal protein S27ae [Candidatus Micrarchaeota archaeon]
MAEKKGKKTLKPYSPRRFCPKCGSSSRLGEHADRRSCGKCKYMEKK